MAKLDLIKLSDDERRVYDEFIEDRRYQVSMFDSSYGDGYNQGKEEGLKEGLKEGERLAKLAIARELLTSGMKAEDVVRMTWLEPEDLSE